MDGLTDSDLILEIERLSQYDNNTLAECIIIIFKAELNKRKRARENMDQQENNLKQEIVQDCLAIIRTCSLRNGPDSSENRVLVNVRNKIIEYFNVPERDVNDVFNSSERFREFLFRRNDRSE